jgi:hypothetical protein
MVVGVSIPMRDSASRLDARSEKSSKDVKHGFLSLQIIGRKTVDRQRGYAIAARATPTTLPE